MAQSWLDRRSGVGDGGRGQPAALQPDGRRRGPCLPRRCGRARQGRRGDDVAPWILFVVGVHFLPLARVFRIRSLVPLAMVCVLVAVAAALTGWVGAALPSAVAGAGGGGALLVESVASLLIWRGLRVAGDV